MPSAVETLLFELGDRFAGAGDAAGTALVARRLGDLALASGQPLRALELYRDSLAMLAAVDERACEDRAACALSVARALLGLGERRAAAEAAELAAHEFEAAGAPMGVGLARLLWALAQPGGPPDEVAAALKQASDAFVAAGHPGAAAIALTRLAEHHLGRAQVPIARLCAEQAERYGGLAGTGAQDGALALVQAGVALASGDATSAEATANKAAPLLGAQGDQAGAVRAMLLAGRAARVAAPGRAARSLGRALAAAVDSALPSLEIEAAVELAEHHAQAGEPPEAQRALSRARRIAAVLPTGAPQALASRIAALAHLG